MAPLGSARSARRGPDRKRRSRWDDRPHQRFRGLRPPHNQCVKQHTCEQDGDYHYLDIELHDVEQCHVSNIRE